MEPFPKKDEAPVELFECPSCGRKLKKEALKKHAPVCENIFKGRKDVGLSIEEREEISKAKVQQPQPGKKNTMQRTAWINQSEELRAVILSKRHDKHFQAPETVFEIVEKNNEPKREKEKEIIQCDLCNKKFSKSSYEDHIEECKAKYKEKKEKQNMKMSNKGDVGKFPEPGKFSGSNPPNYAFKPKAPFKPEGGFAGKKPNFNMKFGK